jgi:uncharacterized coiled-coil DUF342 family protein
MENQTNSIAYNLNKLRKYQERLSASTDPRKNAIYNQKIRFYQQNLKGAGVNDSTVGATNSQNTEVDSLISKIDNLIQKSKATRVSASGRQVGGYQSGGHKSSLSGHRIMTTGSRQQHGGVKTEAELEAERGAAEATAALLIQAQDLIGENIIGDGADEKHILDPVDETADAVVEGFRAVTLESTQKTALIDKLNDRVIELQIEIGRLEGKLAVGTAVADTAGAEIERLTREKEAVERERDELHDKLSEVRREIEAVDALIGEKNPEWIQDPKGDEGDMIDNPHYVDLPQREEAEAVAAELHTNLEAARGELERLIDARDTKIRELEEELATARDEGRRATGEVAETTAEIRTLTQQKNELEAALRDLVAKHEALKERADVLHDRATSYKAQLKTINDHTDFTDEARRARASAEELQRRTREVKTLGGPERANAKAEAEEAARREDEGAAAGDTGLKGGARLDKYLQYSIQVPDGF